MNFRKMFRKMLLFIGQLFSTKSVVDDTINVTEKSKILPPIRIPVNPNTQHCKFDAQFREFQVGYNRELRGYATDCLCGIQMQLSYHETFEIDTDYTSQVWAIPTLFINYANSHPEESFYLTMLYFEHESGKIYPLAWVGYTQDFNVIETIEVKFASGKKSGAVIDYFVNTVLSTVKDVQNHIKTV